MKKILIVDGNPLSRKALMLLVGSKVKDVQVLDASDLDQMRVTVNIHKPELVILDENLIGNDPVDPYLRLILGRCSLILMSVDANKMEFASSLGASFIHKGTSPDHLINLINNIDGSEGEKLAFKWTHSVFCL